MKREKLEQLAAEQGCKLVSEPTPSETVCNWIRSIHGDMQLVTGWMEKGGKPDPIARQSLRVIRAYCDSILEGETPDAADVNDRAMKDVV